MTMMDMHKDSTREVGQFSLPFYGASQLKGKSEAQVADIKLKELKNGRLAMIGKTTITQHCLQILLYPETFGAFPNTHLWTL
jgi:hypothetical protein